MRRPTLLWLLASACSLGPAAARAAEGPSFDCKQVEAGSIAALVCADAGLSALDRTLAQVYAAATKKAVNEHPPTLKAEQRGWLKGRDECWKSEDKRACVESSYRRWTVELQARYVLVPVIATVRYVCAGDERKEVNVRFFKTEPPTLIAERGDAVSLMFIEPSGSGARYVGRNESLWEHQGEARITWGYGSPEQRCTRR